jgi:hypothetical protein
MPDLQSDEYGIHNPGTYKSAIEPFAILAYHVGAILNNSETIDGLAYALGMSRARLGIALGVTDDRMRWILEDLYPGHFAGEGGVKGAPSPDA